MPLSFPILVALVSVVSCTVFFKDDFSDSKWESRWKYSNQKSLGRFGLSAGDYFTNEVVERGLQTLDNSKFYAISAEFKEFSNRGKTLVLQYSLKQEHNIDCAGGYIKLHSADLNQKTYNGNTQYNIMFGPDICANTKRVHVILNKDKVNHLIKQNVPIQPDRFTHVYTLILKPDNTFHVLIDNEEVRAGDIEDHWDIRGSKQIPDPSQKKPADWIDESHIEDVNDKKPADYDTVPREIPDPNAKKPGDWEDDIDGPWDIPMIPNPAFTGKWKPRLIPNPAFKGYWKQPMIDNPKYTKDPNLYAFESFKFVGIEVWQVSSGSIFGNILVTDDIDLAFNEAQAVLSRVPGERAAIEADLAGAKKEDL